jgi:hypothetical protein
MGVPMIDSRCIAHRAQRWGIGVGLVGGAVVAATMIGVSAASVARADDDVTPAELQTTATTDLTDANTALNTALGQPDVSDNLNLQGLVDQQLGLNDNLLQFQDSLVTLQESDLSADTNPIALDLDTALFGDVDQAFSNGDAAVLSASQSFAEAAAAGTLTSSSDFGMAAADLQLLSPDLDALGSLLAAFDIGLLNSF